MKKLFCVCGSFVFCAAVFAQANLVEVSLKEIHYTHGNGEVVDNRESGLYHVRIVSYGAMPESVFRTSILSLLLGRQAEASWKIYDEPTAPAAIEAIKNLLLQNIKVDINTLYLVESYHDNGVFYLYYFYFLSPGISQCQSFLGLVPGYPLFGQ